MITDRPKYALAVLVVTLIALFFYGRIDYENPKYSAWDLHHYRAMARSVPALNEHAGQPFMYRIFGPYIAGILPLTTDSSFLLLSSLSAVVLSILFYYYLCYLTIAPSVAAFTTILFILNKSLFGFPVWNYFHLDDILSQIEVVILMWLMMKRRWSAFGVVLFFGSLTRETPLTMIPVAFVFAYDEHCLKDSWQAFLVGAIAALIPAILLRLLLHSHQGDDLIHALLTNSDKLTRPEIWVRLLINSFIPFSFVPLVFFRYTRDFFRSRRYAIVYLVLVVFSTFFGTNNERLMAPAFIIFFPLLAGIIRDHLSQSHIMMMLLMGGAIVSNLNHMNARFPVPKELVIVLSVSALVTVTAAAWYYSKRGHPESLARSGE